MIFLATLSIKQSLSLLYECIERVEALLENYIIQVANLDRGAISGPWP
jgi:hypothetical protein